MNGSAGFCFPRAFANKNRVPMEKTSSICVCVCVEVIFLGGGGFS